MEDQEISQTVLELLKRRYPDYVEFSDMCSKLKEAGSLTIERILFKLEREGLVTLVTFPGFNQIMIDRVRLKSQKFKMERL